MKHRTSIIPVWSSKIVKQFNLNLRIPKKVMRFRKKHASAYRVRIHSILKALYTTNSLYSFIDEKFGCQKFVRDRRVPTWQENASNKILSGDRVHQKVLVFFRIDQRPWTVFHEQYSMNTDSVLRPSLHTKSHKIIIFLEDVPFFFFEYDSVSLKTPNPTLFQKLMMWKF